MNFSYQRCDDAMWEYQVELNPNQTKNIWLLNTTYSSAFSNSIVLVDLGVFPPVALSPTPTISVTPSNTPTISVTPSNTPTISVTPSVTASSTPTQTQTGTASVTPTNTPTETMIFTGATETPTPTPTVTPTETMIFTGATETPTPTLTPTPTQIVFSFSMKFNVSGSTEACLSGETETYYSNSSTLSGINPYLTTDAGLTTPVSNGYYCLAEGCPNSTGKEWVQVTGGGGAITSTANC